VRLVEEAFIDLEYSAAGTLIIEADKAGVGSRPGSSASADAGPGWRHRCQDGTEIASNAVTVCIHGDGPNAVEIARTVKKKLEEADIAVSPL
jgi:5-oxoprolinase (ATP-hydrolysing) subunit A